MSLTLDEVRAIRFRMARRGETGYSVGDVDTFIDKVELTFAEHEQERDNKGRLRSHRHSTRKDRDDHRTSPEQLALAARAVAA